LGNAERSSHSKTTLLYRAICLIILAIPTAKPLLRVGPASSGIGAATRRVNVPYLGIAPPVDSFTPAIFWFGKVSPLSNYADVRVYYYDEYLGINLHVIDRLLWYDPTHSETNLTAWDAASLYLNLEGNIGETPGTKAYRFDGQLNAWETRDNWQMAYQGNGSNWSTSPISFTTETFWRGNYPNDVVEDRGWSITFKIPFASLGLKGTPNKGDIWGLALALHDRDDVSGMPIADQLWPDAMEPGRPMTWGQMRFGLPAYTPVAAVPSGVFTIRHGLNGVSVPDGHVGGHTTCSEGLWPDIFNTFGNANYAGYGQINIQNQWDISDFACFSKYFVTFPLDSLPPGYLVLSATLTMHQFGSAYGEGVEPSYIQVLTVGEDWDESTLTWNNAPLAVENLIGTWVDPQFDIWPGTPRQWDVSRAAAQAYAANQPLRLALYSADGAYHSGRYFWSSDAGEEGRPTLRVILGVPCHSADIICYFTYLPLALR
jgi:hypothetical protein